MSKHFSYTAARAVFAFLIATGFALLSGCGDLDRSSLITDPAATVQEGAAVSNDRTTITFSPRAPVRAAKRIGGPMALSETSLNATTGLFSRTASGWITPGAGGKLKVSFGKLTADGTKNGEVGVKRATFEVEEGSIDAAYYITMTVYTGATLGEVRVEFTPSGIRFHPPATLTVVLWGKVNADVVKALHIDGSGAVLEEIAVTVEDGKKVTILVLKVPGFSRYDLGGDDDGAGDDPDDYDY